MRKEWVIVTLVVAVGLMGFNAFYFDIGGTLDPEMSAMKFYNEELPKIPDGDIFMGGGWTWAMVYLYNQENDRNIRSVCMDVFPSEEYLDLLIESGINLKKSNEESPINAHADIAMSITQLNDGVWIAKETKPEVYQYVIEPARGNEDYINRWRGQEVEAGNWRWMPSNPYKYIAGELQVAEWHHVLMSNRNMLRVMTYSLFGFGVFYIIKQRIKGRKTQNEQE